MCDYSAQAAKKRDAAQNDVLVTGSISVHTRGFKSATDTSMAVCLLPGTELAFDHHVQVDQARAGATDQSQVKTMLHRVARFTQVEKGNKSTHHDVLEFPDGTQVKLNHLVEGQMASVLQLPAKPNTAAEADEQRRAEYV